MPFFLWNFSLRHSYRNHEVLKGINLRIEPGSIYGFLGRNGSGKTTCIRLLCGLMKRQSGGVNILGVDPELWGREDLCKVGYVPDGAILPSHMRVGTLLGWTRELYPKWSDAIVERLVSAFRLDLRMRIDKLSLGQQRQVAFLLAVAPQPELLVLDEPAANLDVVARRTFLAEIAGLARELETAVFFSTHVLGDVERVADRVGILSEGHLLVDESLDDLKEKVQQVRFHWSRPEPPPVNVPDAYAVRKTAGEVVVTMRVAGDFVARTAESAGCLWEVQTLNLEDLFVELTQGESL